jgi:hypothetical protein
LPRPSRRTPCLSSLRGSVPFTVPEIGIYDILAFGGSGGESGGGGGLGAEIAGDFRLTAGEVLSVVIGANGGGPFPCCFPGNGGGTLVLTSTGTPLVIAGNGGGAADDRNGGDGLISRNGGDGVISGGLGGFDGSGGEEGDGAGGGGLYSAGGVPSAEPQVGPAVVSASAASYRSPASAGRRGLQRRRG